MRKFKIDKNDNPTTPKLTPYKKKAYVHKWWLTEMDNENDEVIIDDTMKEEEEE